MKVEIKSQSRAKHDWKSGDLFSYGTDGLFVVRHISGSGVIHCTVVIPRCVSDASPAGENTEFYSSTALRRVVDLKATVE